MAWAGYGEYAGNEIYNSARTAAYAKNNGAYWFKGCFDDEWLPLMLGDGAQYTTPLLDNAPWVDPDIPASFDFWGAYPISVDGIEDSTRTATVNESTLDGGIPGRIRHATKSVVFNMALLGATECAVEYGMRWLRRAADLRRTLARPSARAASNSPMPAPMPQWSIATIGSDSAPPQR